MKIGIYVHVPYCMRKCRYCDFASAPIKGREGSVGPYFARLWNDIERTGRYYGGRLEADTVFFGGGTPSLVDAEYICKTLDVISKYFTVNQGAEISIEANPGTLSREKLASYSASGINRLSLGIQSFDDGVLSVMGRIHDSMEALKSYELSRRYFDNINLDLMMGVPAQSLKIWLDTLSRAVGLAPEHLSFYSLQLEEGTPFYNDYKNGLLELPSVKEDRLMYHEGLKLMEAAGYRRYEVSNAAKPGFACRHNLKYWTMEPYLGFGSAAHSFIGGRRFEDGALPVLSEDGALSEEAFESVVKNSKSFEPADPGRINDLKGDFIFTQLRLADGMDGGLYARLFGRPIEDDFGIPLRKLIKEGFIEEAEGCIRLTASGLDATNPVMEELLSAL